MFRAVREYWASGKGKHALRLFGFELAVVMIGVLAAQQVSNWAQRKSDLTQVEGLHRDLLKAFGGYRVVADTYRAAIPCLDQRANLLLRLAGNKQSADPRQLGGARLVLMAPDKISPGNAQLLRDRYGDEVADKIDSMEFNLETAGQDGRALASKWVEFQRINPQLGPVQDEDWAAARAAAVQIKGLLSNLLAVADRIEHQTSRLGVGPDPHFDLTPVTNCDQVWRDGQAYVRRES